MISDDDERERLVAEQYRRAYGEDPLSADEAWAIETGRMAIAAEPWEPPRCVRIVTPDTVSVGIEALLRRRHRLGHDLLDEVWDGEYHMIPAPAGRHARIVQQLAEILGPAARRAGLAPMISIFNLGEPNNYRVPDGGVFRESKDHMYYPTAALVVEVVSPGDETWDKLPFYAGRNVDELLIVDPQRRSVDWLALEDNGYQPVERSRLIDMPRADLVERIDWPPA